MLEKPRSVPGKTRNFAVAASPFNLVKLELGVVIVAAVLWLAAVSAFVDSGVAQLLLIAAYGAGATTWLVLRTSRVLRHHASKSRDLDP
jgi:hypothetical protein